MSCKITFTPAIACILYFTTFLTTTCESEKLEICNKYCTEPLNNSSKVSNFCKEHSEDGYYLQGRCCLNHTDIRGLDLAGCNLQNVTDLFVNMSSLNFLVLDDNPLKHISGLDLRGAVDLQNLTIPLQLDCPGGPSAWCSVENHTDSKWCNGEKDTCLSTEYCPVNVSECVHVAPGSYECPCAINHHGYKCLRQGHFPTDIFLGSIGGAGVAIAGFLWFTQRRHVLKYI